MPSDIFSYYLLHSLSFIPFIYVRKIIILQSLSLPHLIKIPHILDFQKFPNPPNYCSNRLFGNQEHVRLKKHLISATYLAETEWSLVLTDITSTQKR